MRNIPFLSLKDINQPFKEEYLHALEKVVDSGWYIQGKQLADFEQAFADYCGAKHCVGVGTGLDALELILQGIGIGRGDEVILPAHTFIATFLAISNVGAVPVPVEPDVASMNIDVDKIAAAITPHTKAIIAVHLYGRPCEMEKLRALADQHGLKIIEDAAQAHGTKYNDKYAGNLADAAAFSFYPAKTLGALGDGGAVVTNDDALAAAIRRLGNYGSEEKYVHLEKGGNSRLDELQAAFLNIKLKHLEKDNAARRAVAKAYLQGIHNKAIILPLADDDSHQSAWHLFVVRTQDRERLAKHLQEQGVQTAMHYPCAFNKQPAYTQEFGRQAFPITEEICGTLLSLPMSPTLEQDDIDYVIKAVNEY